MKKHRQTRSRRQAHRRMPSSGHHKRSAHAQTDVQRENIMPEALSKGQAEA